jgi:hypothetical protein
LGGEISDKLMDIIHGGGLQGTVCRWTLAGLGLGRLAGMSPVDGLMLDFRGGFAVCYRLGGIGVGILGWCQRWVNRNGGL